MKAEFKARPPASVVKEIKILNWASYAMKQNHIWTSADCKKADAINYRLKQLEVNL